ncbi:anthrone oxygenase family protein [Sphingomonas sp. 2378]|uniref:anthrone oxygenase family protein n=1 Tax=Sphingomonas sp. 2378 TaxID=1219748 RepID=UPI00311B2464
MTLLANWSFTLFAIMPTYRQLKVIRSDEVGPASRALLVSWGKLHNVRSVLGVVATAIFGLALAGIA